MAIGAPRLKGLGLNLPQLLPPQPELRLYRLLVADRPEGAHARFNALVRRLVSYERALEQEQARARRLGLSRHPESGPHV
ncbi:MAG: hypothetical protein AB1505_02820 [Candidatus Latescibacterota bacterium]